MPPRKRGCVQRWLRGLASPAQKSATATPTRFVCSQVKQSEISISRAIPAAYSSRFGTRIPCALWSITPLVTSNCALIWRGRTLLLRRWLRRKWQTHFMCHSRPHKRFSSPTHLKTAGPSNASRYALSTWATPLPHRKLMMLSRCWELYLSSDSSRPHPVRTSWPFVRHSRC